MRTLFTKEEVERLRHNPCVFSCTQRSINYTYEFKKQALALHAQGVTAREIWRRSGFNTSTWRKSYCKDTLHDWKSIVKRKGIAGLLKPGGVQYDRGPDTTGKDKLKRLELQVTYLQAENAFLAKLRAKRAESNSRPLRNTSSSEQYNKT